MASTVRSLPARPRSGTKRGVDIVAKTLADVVGVVERAIFAEEHARRDGALQRLDPRVKLVGLGILLLVVGLSRQIGVIAALYVVTVVLAILSRIPVRFFVGRVWIGIPLVAGVVALPALVLTPGTPIVPLLEVGPVHLAITDRSIGSTSVFVCRVGTSVSIAVLLVLTTRWSDLLKAFRVLAVPEAFVVVLGMTYRYIFLLLRSVDSLLLARKSRSVGFTRGDEQRRWIAASVGTLMSRSFKLSNDVYLAMVARGYSGNIRTSWQFQMRDQDWFFAALMVLVAAVALWVDRWLA